MTDGEWYYVIIPFRDRGTDPLRKANLDRVLQHWRDHHFTEATVVGDGRSGRELFNRSAAYNLGIRAVPPDADGYIFAESDMLVPPDQVDQAVNLASESLGMVVPFSTYCYQGDENSAAIREHLRKPQECVPRWRKENCTSIGAINVVSRATMEAVGQWDEKFEGNWYDDNAMDVAFSTICAPTRFVPGEGHHLHHLPGHRGKHLSDKEKAATAANQRRLTAYERAASTNNVAELRRLLKGER